MIESIKFENFKALRNATLPLSPCTVLVGPNGSGKTTVLQALEMISGKEVMDFREVMSAGVQPDKRTKVEIRLYWGQPFGGAESFLRCLPTLTRTKDIDVSKGGPHDTNDFNRCMDNMRVFSLDATAIAAPAALEKNVELARNGAKFSAVLDRLRDEDEARFEALNEEVEQWLPEFDRLSFDLTGDGQRVIFMRTRNGHYKIPARDLSQGTLIALVILTLAYLPNPPSLIGLEEPDRGIHPRLLRRVQEVLYRLSYPESCGEDRRPVQVIATTHSPYFLDLFKDRPEEIVIANKEGGEVKFERLSEQPHLLEVLGDAPLGEVWYSGVLGGVPSNS